MTNNYCLPIIKSTQQQVRSTIKKHSNDYAYFEVYLDYIEDLDTTFVEKLAAEYAGRLLVVFHRLNLQPAQMTLSQQKALLNTLKDKNILIDLDVDSQEEQIDHLMAQKPKARTIISYHNYQQTPNNKALEDILQRIRKKNPYISKIATECQNKYDALRLLAVLLHVKEANQRAIVLGMGEQGAITRVFGSLWGNELSFVPETAQDQSAPGQLTRRAMDDILKNLGEE